MLHALLVPLVTLNFPKLALQTEDEYVNDIWAVSVAALPGREMCENMQFVLLTLHEYSFAKIPMIQSR